MKRGGEDEEEEITQIGDKMEEGEEDFPSVKQGTLVQTGSFGVLVSDVPKDQPTVYVLTGFRAEEVVSYNSLSQRRREFKRNRHMDSSVTTKIRRRLKTGVECRGELLKFESSGSPLNRLKLNQIIGDDKTITHVTAIQFFADLEPEASIYRFNTDSSTCKPFLAGHWVVCSISELNEEVLLENILSRLELRDVVAVSCVSKLLHQVTKDDQLWRTLGKNAWGSETTRMLETVPSGKRLGWERLVKELTTLEAVAWRKTNVGCSVVPPRCNFCTRAVGNQVFLFGGEGVNMQPMNDTFVLDFNNCNPEWRQVMVSSSPSGRWGHTLSCVKGTCLVIFGGYGKQGLLNDVFVLDLNETDLGWREVLAVNKPEPRSWHSSCIIDDNKLLVSGGCSESGILLNDTFLLDLTAENPSWKEIETSWTPSPRLGHTLSPYDPSKVLMFGGFTKKGPIRLRSSDVFTMDLKEENPCWHRLKISGAGNLASVIPPRLGHVALNLPGGRILIFGGSVIGSQSTCKLYVLDPTVEKPIWRILKVSGQPPSGAWGNSTSVVGGTRAIVLGGQTVEDSQLSELYELSLTSFVL